MSCWKESIVPLSQTSFVSLLRHIVHFGVREVVFSRTAPILNQASQSEFARIDIVLSGKKHMRYPASGKIMDAYLEPGSMHYSPPMTAKLPLGRELAEAGVSLVGDTCVDQPCWHKLRGMKLLTDSPKCFYYTSRRGLRFTVTSAERCIDAALEPRR